MSIILDGRATSEKVMEELAEEAKKLAESGITPGLSLIITGDDKYSLRYVKLKQRRAESVGIYVDFHHLEETTNEELVSLIQKLNKDPKIHGIMVQLPLMEGLDEIKVVDAIAPMKDVDGLSPNTLGKLLMGEDCYPPAGVEAIVELFKRYDLDVDGKHWLVAGETNFLSKPLAAYLMNRKVRVTQVGPGCPHLPDLVKMADVVSTELFKKHAVTSDMVKDGVIVIDNGNNYEGKNVYGDVDPAALEKASAYTPVPGGTGPMLISMLLRNTLKAASS
jgi:methylenetetrahydrofolate dehydrogenase (NADP+)/methenyltetrahydrofolate cyclohydrolase